MGARRKRRSIGVRVATMRLPLLLALLALYSCAAQEDPDDTWIEHFDKDSGKPFYYHSRTRETAWQAPIGARVKYMDSTSGGGSRPTSQKKDTSLGSFWVLMAVIIPVGLPLVGLAVCYHMASKEGLGDVLKAMKARRDRSAKRRGTKAGGNFRQRHKTSQDGKGGRSANS